MRILLIGDIHGNLEALESCMEICSDKKIDRVNVLGDIVGYMANPNECIERVRSYECISGNHDIAIYDDIELEMFNPYARQAIMWTRSKIKNEHIDFLKSLPSSRTYLDENYTIVHGSLVDKNMYIMSRYQASVNARLCPTDLLFTAHTHIPKIWDMPKGNNSLKGAPYGAPVAEDMYDGAICLLKNRKYVINIGSLGQPRDNNPKGCCLIYDTDEYTISYIRFAYPMDSTIEKIKMNGLPLYLYSRILKGI